MERYNLSAEHIVKLLYRKKINRVTSTNSENFFNSPIFAEVFGNNSSNNNYKISWEEINRTEIRLKTNLPRVLRRYYHECGDFDINRCFGNNSSNNNYKISWEEINRTEIRLKTNLPRVLRRYYHECGDFDINRCLSSILNLDEIGFSHDWEREALEDDETPKDEIEKTLKEIDNFLIFWTENQGVWNAGIKKEDLSLENPPVEDDETPKDEIEKTLKEIDNFLIFWTENQGVWNAGIKKEDLSLENPPVYMTTNDDLYSWEKVTDDIDTFIILQVLDNLQSSGFYFLTFDSEEIDYLLQDKKISKDELLKNPFKIKERNLKFPIYLNYDYKGDKIYIFQMKDNKFEKCFLIKPSVKKDETSYAECFLIKPSVEKDETSYADKILLKITEILSFNNREVVKKLELILEDFNKYLRNDINFRYIDNEINALSNREKIELKILAMVWFLSESRYICYLDWKCELEDFQMIFDVMKKVGIDENICNIKDLKLDEDDDIEIWSEEFNKVFSKKDIFIGNINTSSDSYSIFPINRKNLEKLRELGNRINMKIDFFNYSQEDKTMWQEMYERNKEKFRCKIDLESYFNEKKIGKMKVDTLEIGEVNLPTGEILACDPLIELGEARTYLQKTPVGKFPVKIAVVLSEVH